MVNINTLKAQVNAADNNARLRLDSNQQVELMTGSFFGRQVERLNSGTFTVSRRAENQAIKDAVVQALRGHYGKAIADTTNPLTNSDKPLTAQMVKEWIQAADDAVMQTLCQKLTAQRDPEDTNTKYEDKNFSLKQEFVAHLSEKYGDTAMNLALKVVDMSPETTWTTLDIKRLEDTANALHLQPAAKHQTSNHASAYFGDTNQVGEAKHLGAGTTNEVSIGKWANQSEVTEKVFKPLPEKAPENMGIHGINAQGDGNLAGRNVASSEIAHALGMPDKITASHIGQQNGVQGIFMDKAQGTSIATESFVVTLSTPYNSLNQAAKDALNYALADKNLEVASSDGTQIRLQVKHADRLREEILGKVQERINQLNEDLPPDAQLHMSASGEISAGPNDKYGYAEQMKNDLQNKLAAVLTITTLPLDHNGRITDPKLNLELNQMQWLDFICGQADRNPGNIFIQYDAQGVATGITGIDQDLSFGENVDAKFKRGFFKGMPKHIDGDTASKIKALYKNDGAQFAEMLRNNGLSPQEVTQAQARLQSAYDAILQWETQPASVTTQGILPAQSAQWGYINTDGYSKFFSDLAHTNNTNINVSQLEALLNTSEPVLLKLKSDIEVQRHIGQRLEEVCNQCQTPAGQALALSVLQQLTPQERTLVLSQASPQQITTLAGLANPHPDALAELQRRYQTDTQRFHATVQRLQAEDLNLPTSLTNAPAFTETIVQLAETWAALETYADHPNTPISTQTQAEHQFLQGYLQTQTQRETLAADDLNDTQLGKLNQALKKLVPSQQRASILGGFKDVFTTEFANRLMAQSMQATATWTALLAAPPSQASMQHTMNTLQALNQHRELVIERAANLLMDGARNHAIVETILQAPLSEALSQLTLQAAQAQSQPWMQANVVDVLEQNAHLLAPATDEEEAQLGHLMALLPALIRTANQPDAQDEHASLLTTLHKAQQLTATLASHPKDGGIAALHAFLVAPEVSASLLAQLQAADHSKLVKVFANITSENRSTLDSLFLVGNNAKLQQANWSRKDLLTDVSKYSDFLQKNPTPQDMAMLRSLTSGPMGSSELLDFDAAVTAFKQTPTVLGALDLLQSFVVAANTQNSGFGMFDAIAPTSSSTGPREINVDAKTYRQTAENMVATIKQMIDETLRDQISQMLTPTI